MDVLPLLLQLFSGAVGGNLAGAAFEKLDLGLIGNSLAGLVGGGIGGRIFQQIAGPNAADIAEVPIFLTCVAGGSIGGALTLMLAGWIRNAVTGRRPPL